MTAAELDLGRSTFDSAGVMAASYLTVPVTSGIREIRLMQRHGITDRSELRRSHPEEYHAEVFAANLADARSMAERLRHYLEGREVINPGAFDRPGWTQVDYMSYWLAALTERCVDLRMPSQSIYSSGGRTEVWCALASHIRVYNLDGQQLAASDVEALDTRARAQLRSSGWSAEQIERYMPWIDYATASRSFEPARDAIAQFAELAVRHNAEIKTAQVDA